ncbi:MAG TPA: Asp-tRNA(Asn)/Glu-tRNA(Gln) amidotransferase subunit GatC [Catalimonadaceae bacterium]|nr:Asp-tRNA(Asn)/Glu-tRNA(Gln) amidotransferase subunit GatC [Catalimonadaceae bacterium]HPI09796.1 Asp-tRNA(Asn)/Glu-tRNA(Gln) amidotransferase subunit GatC [Catalimonadaceae bacterium]
MKIDPQTIDKMAHLARLNVQESEKAGIAESLEQILSWMEKLSELDTDGVEPLVHMSAEINSMRQDIGSHPILPEIALSNAPSERDSFFVVPKVLEV